MNTTRPYRTEAKPDLFRVEFGNPWELEGDFIIIGDVHVPTVDLDFAVLPSRIALKHLKKPRRLLIAGDLFNMDEFSKYDKIMKPGAFYMERDAAHQLFKEWLEIFDDIYFMMGNHDRRIEKWTNGNLGGQDLISLILTEKDGNDTIQTLGSGRVHASEFGYCTIKTVRGPWRVTHPKNYSINTLTVADQLAQKFQMNIIAHHEHHVGIALDKYSRYVVVNNGGLHDYRKMSYVMMDDNKMPVMANSFVMLKGGYCHLFGDERLTDYSRWL